MRLRPEDCTLGHQRAALTAARVRTILTALVAMGQFDLERFLVRTTHTGGTPPSPSADPPPDKRPSPQKYLDYLRGRRVLHDINARRLERTICSYAETVAGSSVGPVLAGGLPQRSYRSVAAVASSMHGPLLDAQLLYVKDRHIVLWQQPATRADWQRQDALLGWAEYVRLLRRETPQLRHLCFCHTVQLLYDDGDAGPPNEHTVFGRGGRRLEDAWS